MFGELVGAWAAEVWCGMGRPEPVLLAELGPGRGTLMRDALRAAARLPGFAAAARPWLVETSAALRVVQAGALAAHAPSWAARVEELPEEPLILIANEFFDALPIRQFQRDDALWRERWVERTGDGLGFVWGPARADADLDARFPLAPDRALVEVSLGAEVIAAELGARLARHGGAALVIDYGAWDGMGDTLQALRGHRPADPLADPGEVDLTTHVRFRALAEAARGARAHGPLGQGVFLERLGITARALALARGRTGATLAAVVGEHRRLTHPEEMGALFQVLALVPGDAPTPPGFDA
jgi:NADH dehydrogenase [ubiquinone] 1 alpha subcomplex assembly factor 7